MRRRSFLVAAGMSALPLAASAAEQRRVVLELFTSQGCSSCPPADALLGELAHRPDIIALAWHVDYWNGRWRDPFASHFATERQRAYAERLGEHIYTPALVVNGAQMVVGSDGAQVRAAMAASPPLPVEVSLRQGAGGLTAEIGAAPVPVAALLARFDPEHQTQIGAGENDGRLLREYNTVRSVVPVANWDGQARTLHFDAPPVGTGVALLVQDDRLRVLGAAVQHPQGTIAA